MANNLIADLEALLEGFRDDILTEAFILNVHNRVVEVRIECGACGSVDDGDVNALEAFGQLCHGQLDTLFIFGVGGLCLERPLEVIVGRQQCGYGAADCIGVRLLALALAALAEVVVLRRHAEITIVQVVILGFPVRRGLCISLGGLLCGSFGLYLLLLFRLRLCLFAHVVLCLRLQEISDFRLFHLKMSRQSACSALLRSG